MLRRSTIIALEILVGLFAISAIGVGILLWRLTSGPVALDFLTPHLSAAFEDAVEHTRAEIGETVLLWQGWKRPVRLTARNVRLLDLEGQIGVRLPEVAVRLSLSALLRGVVAPTIIELSDASFLLQRKADGSLIFSQREGERNYKEIPGAAPTSGLSKLIESLPDKPVPDRPLSYLTSVRILDSEVTFIDLQQDQVWSIPIRFLAVARDGGSLVADISATIGHEAAAPEVSLSLIYDRSTALLDLSGDFWRLNPVDFASLDEQLAALNDIDLPLTGRLSGTVNAEGELMLGRLELRGEAGVLRLPELGFDSLPVRELELALVADDRLRKLTVEGASVMLPVDGESGPKIELSGELTAPAPDLAGDLSFSGQVGVDRLQVRDLPSLWRETIAPDPRPWILENLEGGAITDLAMELAGILPGGDPDALELSKLQGEFSIDKIAAHYLRPLPPVTEISGSAIFDSDSLSFTLEGGHVGNLRTQDATVIISNLSGVDLEKGIYEEMYIDLDVVGPVKDSFILLNHPRLDLLSELGIDPAGSSGAATTRLVLRFPLILDLGLEDMEITANSVFSDLVMNDFLLGHVVASERIELELDISGMHLFGPASIAGVDLEVDWKESFQAGTGLRDEVTALVPSLDDAGRRALGIDPGDTLRGPVSASLYLTTDHDRSGQLKIAANLQDAQLSFPEINWEKPPGAPGQTHLILSLQDFQPTSLDHIALDFGDLEGTGRGLPSTEGQGLAMIEFDQISFPAGQLQGLRLDWREEALEVTIAGGEIDAAAFIYDDEETAGEKTAEEEAGPETPAAREPFTLHANHLTALHFGEGRWLENVTLSLDQSAEGWRRIYLDGEIPETLRSPPPEADEGKDLLNRTEGVTADGGAPDEPPEEPVVIEPPVTPRLLFDFAPAEAGGQTLLVRTEDMGGVLRALNLMDTVKGGDLKVTGTGDGPLPHYPLQARLKAKDFILVDAPVLARILTLASITGPLDMIGGEGLGFRRLVGDFSLVDGIADSELMRMYGSGLGLTAKGQIDFDRDESDFRGTVVPAYTLNQILGEVPLLGPLLTGGEGEGFLAVTYEAKGPLDDLDVSVNPLSALAPGFLRSLFTSDGGEEDEPGDEPDFKAERQDK